MLKTAKQPRDSINPTEVTMNTLHKLALAGAILAAPSLAVAQKAPHPTHPTPPVVMGKSGPVRQDDRPDKLADKAERKTERTADETARNADKVADKTARNTEKAADKAERSEDKLDRSELKFAHQQKLLTKGIKLTLAEKKQIKAIEKKYDEDYRDLRQKELAADKAAKKNGTVESDATFEAQLATLQANERNAMRAALTPAQQSIFDSNVVKLSSK
jgi:hypothetical protein